MQTKFTSIADAIIHGQSAFVYQKSVYYIDYARDDILHGKRITDGKRIAVPFEKVEGFKQMTRKFA